MVSTKSEPLVRLQGTPPPKCRPIGIISLAEIASQSIEWQEVKRKVLSP